MSTVRSYAAAAVLKTGQVLVVGGYNSRSSGSELSSAELYDVTSGSWQPAGAMSVPRASATATTLSDGRVLVAGGFDGSALSTAEIYDPVSGTWNLTGSMATGRYYHSATALNSGLILVAGGFGVSSAELYYYNAS
jgi:hypothetical protein